MNSFCQQFGNRNPTTSAVRSKCRKSENGHRLVLEFAFSTEVVQIMNWMKGDLLDVSQNGDLLVFKRFKLGRALHGQPLTVRYSFPKSELKAIQKSFGFDVSVSNFWEVYTVNKDELILKLTDVNIPVLE